MAAHTLTQKGISCLMLDAGPLVDFPRQRVTKAVHELPYRGFGKPGRLAHVVQANEFNANQWVDETQVPYTHDPEEPYNWVRVRMIGGKSLFWARMSFRLSDYEFKAKDHDGFGDNWPISYSDLAPYYDKVEPIFRVSGPTETRRRALRLLPRPYTYELYWKRYRRYPPNNHELPLATSPRQACSDSTVLLTTSYVVVPESARS